MGVARVLALMLGFVAVPLIGPCFRAPLWDKQATAELAANSLGGNVEQWVCRFPI
jgi:hypothetical protein